MHFLFVFAVLITGFFISKGDEYPSRQIHLSELEDYIARLDSIPDGWKREFEKLPPPQTQMKEWRIASIYENLAKHRYPPPEDNLLAYDETRVVLHRVGRDPHSDFINANWVEGNGNRRRYIGTQCPIPSTISDFFRMIWQYNVHQVVMLASPHDVEKGKCAEYFTNSTAMYGDIEIELQRTISHPDVFQRIYSLKRGASAKVLVHYHFLSWPDLGVPNDPDQILRLIQLYRSSDTYTKEWPLTVHCSAGVGRTGTFLLTDAMFDSAMATQTVDFLHHLAVIRHERVSLVEKPEQFALAHRVILKAYKDGLFNKDMENGHSTLSNQGSSSKKTNIVIVNSKLGDEEIVIRLTSKDESCQK